MNMSNELQSTQQEPSADALNSRLNWLDQHWIKILFSTLIIRYDRLNALAGQHPDLAARIRQWGATNGRLWWAIEMNSPLGAFWAHRRGLQRILSRYGLCPARGAVSRSTTRGTVRTTSAGALQDVPGWTAASCRMGLSRYSSGPRPLGMSPAPAFRYHCEASLLMISRDGCRGSRTGQTMAKGARYCTFGHDAGQTCRLASRMCSILHIPLHNCWHSSIIAQ
ncbi:MAG: hypothetical protein IPJ06_00705 [Saprospiraceae bacterium]|nr:hypothetical protein [Saprospiraceae bacterium]